MTPPGFTSDGCTGFPDVWRGIDLTACCTAHDLAWYNHPGDWLAYAVSNVELANCFAASGAPELWAGAILAVFTVGAVLFGLKKRKTPT